MTDPYKFKYFLDSGAFSQYNMLSKKKLSEDQDNNMMGTSLADRKYNSYDYTETESYHQYRNDYIDFCLKYKNKMTAYANLDVINSANLTQVNQKIMEQAGLNPIPVYHLGTDTKWLDYYVKRYEYIAIGGMVPNPVNVLIPILDKLFKEHILDKDGFPKVRVHGFASTSMRLIMRYPWYSSDSTTCRRYAMYGNIILPDYGRQNPMRIYGVSSRPIKTHPDKVGMFSMEDAPSGNLFGQFSKQERKAFDERCERYGMSIEQLGSQVTMRVIWNYLVFSEIIRKTVPTWPWSMETRVPLSYTNDCVEDEYLTYYFAGILTKTEEEKFWNGINVPHTEILKGTLRSFFYKNNSEYVVNLKK